MKHNKSKWRRYINIILGIPNNKTRIDDIETESTSERTEHPSGRMSYNIRNERKDDWAQSADMSDADITIQHCAVPN